MSTGSEQKRTLEWLTPGKALYYGYQFHVARAPAYHGEDQKLAERLAREFGSLRAEVGSAEWVFLSGVQATALSYGNGITRERGAYERRVALALTIYRGDEKYMRDARTVMIPIRTAMRYGALTLLGIIGFEIARVVGHYVPYQVAEKTGSTLPSVLLGAAFFLIGGYVSLWWSNYQLKNLEDKKDIRLYRLDQLYDEARIELYTNSWAQLAKLWTDYTGKDLPPDELPSYLHLLQNEASAQKQLYNLQRTLSRTDLQVYIIEPARKVLSRLRRKKPVHNDAEVGPA
jgi:hypothetical protein